MSRWSRIGNFLRTPGYAAWSALSIVALSIVSSLYSAELRVAWPLGPWGPVPYGPAIIFWGCAVLVFVTVLLRQYAVDAGRQRVQQELESTRNQLEGQLALLHSIVRTNPGPGFLTELGIRYEKFEQLVRELEQIDASTQEMEDALRIGLNHLAYLAWTYDGQPKDVIYSTNLMLAMETVPAGVSLKFVDDAVDIKQLQTTLYLRPETSTTHRSPDPDPDIEPFALPVSMQPGKDRDDGGTGWRLLPGAPFAFSRQRVSHFSDVRSIQTWCEDHADFTRAILAELTEFFQNSPLDGFFSCPLYLPTVDYIDDAANREVIGVLNVHWTKRGLLRDPDAALQFTHSTYPLRVLLARVASSAQNCKAGTERSSSR